MAIKLALKLRKKIKITKATKANENSNVIITLCTEAATKRELSIVRLIYQEFAF
ncbi:MAG: hypothetical protein K0R49_1330 [Burkholderiales bacterium]|nr:hypothetical protein [Burkholderiales bacterium]